ncbi:hypothetical protein V2J09_003403 [Rumex salicifolius]
MVFSNEYYQPLLPNFHSSSSTSTFGLEFNPFQHQNFPHQMGNVFLPQLPIYHQDPPPNNETSTPSCIPNHTNVLHPNQEGEALSLAKKNRHTKISTAHGLRDRRVRLSMGVAREFFDLQDMLGFDKASKTLGWLLAKSKSAIQELALEKKRLGFQGSFSFDTNTEDPIGSSTTSSTPIRRSKKMRLCSDFGREQSSCKSAIRKGYNCNISLVAREKREKARERARERTRAKMSTKAKSVQIEHHGYCSSNLVVDSNVEGLNQYCRLVDDDDTHTLHLSRLIGSAGYSMSHPIAPRGINHGDDPISSLLGWNINEMHIYGQLETNQLHQ